QANRVALSSGLINTKQAAEQGGTVVKGRKSIPVILLTFSDTQRAPFTPASLQKQLFGFWPTGTMNDYYREVSYGQLAVTGTVSLWHRASQPADYYAGPVDEQGKPCAGMCPASRLGELLKEVL